jgi:hypothetical protein
MTARNAVAAAPLRVVLFASLKAPPVVRSRAR